MRFKLKNMSKKTGVKETEDKMIQLENQLKRAVADYQNLEKRVQEDSLAVVQYSRTQLISRLLPALDSLDQAVAGASEAETNSGWLKGVMMSIKQLRQILVDEGLLEVEVSGKFDPNLHEAVDVKEGEDNLILQVVQRGYTLNGKVVRPARVVVGKKNSVEMGEEAKKEAEMEKV